MARTGSPATRHLAAVERATAVLDALATTTADMGTNELARATGINASTVSRLLATLTASGYVEHVADTGRYRLGTRLVQLSQAVLARLDVRQDTIGANALVTVDVPPGSMAFGVPARIIPRPAREARP